MSKAICQSNKDLDENLLLGYLFFYNLGEVKISEHDLEQIFLDNGLDVGYIKKINKADAFRRASSKTKATITIDYNGEKTKAKLEVDEVKTNTDGIVRLVGRKLVDEKNEALSYEAIGKIVFDRNSERMITETNPYFSSEYNYTAVMEEASDRYTEWTQFHTRDTVRNITNGILEDMIPVNLLPSGLAKFIPKSMKPTLYSLQGVIRDLTAYGTNCLFEVIPVVDTDEQRSMVSNAAEREVKEDLYNFTQELKLVLDEKQVITARTATSYVEKFKTLQTKVNSYESLLGSYMEVLKQQITHAVNYVQTNTEGSDSVGSISA